MKTHHKEKMHVITYCMKEMRQSELKAEQDSIEHIRKLQSLKKHKLRDIDDNTEDRNDLEIEETENELLL